MLIIARMHTQEKQIGYPITYLWYTLSCYSLPSIHWSFRLHLFTSALRRVRFTSSTSLPLLMMFSDSCRKKFCKSHCASVRHYFYSASAAAPCLRQALWRERTNIAHPDYTLFTGWCVHRYNAEEENANDYLLGLVLSQVCAPPVIQKVGSWSSSQAVFLSYMAVNKYTVNVAFAAVLIVFTTVVKIA